MPTASIEETLARARSALATPTLYWLGHGGWTGRGAVTPRPGQPLDPQAALDALEAKDSAKHAAYRAGLDRIGLTVDQLPSVACDCSGFVAWCLGVPRFPMALAGKAENWLYTDSMHADARGRRQLFTALEQAQVGALLVYPSAGAARPVGHVALISEVADGRATRMIHCAPENFLLPPAPGQPRNAILETGTEHFDQVRDTLVVAWNAFLPG